MPDFVFVLLKIVTMFLVMALGWIAFRYRYMTKEAIRVLSRLLVDMAFPALVFTQLIRTVDRQSVSTGWLIICFGVGIIIIAELVGLLVLPFFCRKEKMPTAVFLVAIPNWVYLPLPIVAGLFGDAGVRDLLLLNAGCLLALWTVGVWKLRGSAPDLESLKKLLTNPGLIATAGGILVAVFFPWAGNLDMSPADQPSVGIHIGSAVIQALTMLGSLTIPLSLLITGAQLGSLDMADHRPTRDFIGVVFSRLIVAPVITVIIVLLAGWFGLVLPERIRLIGYLVACMPVAITCSIMTDRFRGDTQLAARTTFYTTLLSIVTVPAFYYLIQHFNL